jgi:hypothetical protein
MRRAFRWFFEDRQTHRISIVQWPNVRLWIYIVAAAVRTVTEGGVSRVAGVIATVALVVWAGDEVIRGVNPFRRLLGAAVIAGMLLAWLR